MFSGNILRVKCKLCNLEGQGHKEKEKSVHGSITMFVATEAKQWCANWSPQGPNIGSHHDDRPGLGQCHVQFLVVKINHAASILEHAL